MKKIIIFLTTLLLSFSYADNNATQKLIAEYEEKAFYHQWIRHEHDMALGFHKEACKLGSPEGCANVASMYWNGDKDHKQNKEKTFEYNLKGCELNNAYACLGTGVAYEEGWLSDPDYRKALYYYKKACKLNGVGSPDACKKVEEYSEHCTNGISDEKANFPMKNAKVVRVFGSYAKPAPKEKASKKTIARKSITLKIARGQNNKVYNVLDGKVIFVGGN